MALTLVQITFKVHVPRSVFEQAVQADAPQIAAVPGLLWKIWAWNDAGPAFAGTYLFADAAAAEAYVNGPIIAHIKAAPPFSDFEIRQSTVLESLSALTRGPLPESLPLG